MNSLLRSMTHRVPEGAEGHVRQGWFLDRFDSNVVLVELSGYFVLAHHYSARICTYWYSMGLHHHRLDRPRFD